MPKSDEQVVAEMALQNRMKILDKLETASALSAITAVIDSAPGIYQEHPLVTAQKKLEHNLREFKNVST